MTSIENITHCYQKINKNTIGFSQTINQINPSIQRAEPRLSDAGENRLPGERLLIELSAHLIIRLISVPTRFAVIPTEFKWVSQVLLPFATES